jgi:lysophospholipase L1-like esterase
MIKSKSISYRVLKIVLYSLYLFIAVFVLLEIALRLYDPFRFRIKGDNILLPANQVQHITNKINPKLDAKITNSRNSLGLRGPDTPADFSSKLSVITIGGSTTECRFLDDNKTWSARLGEILQDEFPNVWVNNAGLDGHSTYGHSVMLNDHIKKLRPKMVVFLTGVNDIENDGPSFFDKLNTKNSFPDLSHFILNNSEVINAVVNIWRGARAWHFNNTTQRARVPGQMGNLVLTESEINNRLDVQKKFLDQYHTRLLALADTCKSNNIMPVFLTQPCLYGPGRDSVTGVDLSLAKVEDGMNGELLKAILDQYNAEVKKAAEKVGAHCIDLAAAMPRNSLYYYDQTHFTNEGAELVARVVADSLSELIRRYYLQ